MSTPLIICDNCGARWRLPEGFAGAQSKCRQCGSAIDVARQRNGGDGAPAAARPAAGARPAVDRSREPRPVERPAAAASAPARGGRERVRDEPRRRRSERESAKRSKLPFVIAGVVVLAVVIAIVALS
jgi:hypothetical protein